MAADFQDYRFDIDTVYQCLLKTYENAQHQNTPTNSPPQPPIKLLQCVLVAPHGDGAYAVGFSAGLRAKGTALRRICTGAH